METIDWYQKFKISDNGKISLMNDATGSKYKVAKKAAGYMSGSFTFMDVGCMWGGVGLSFAQDFPQSNGTLIDVQDNFINEVSRLANVTGLKNVNIEKQNFLYMEEKFDLTLFFSVIHHYMYDFGKDKYIFENTLKKFKSLTNKITVIEIATLNDVISRKHLGDKINIFTLDFIEKTLSKYFKIIDKDFIDYSPDTTPHERYAFILEVIDA